MEPIVNRDPGDETTHLVTVLRDCVECGAAVLATPDDEQPRCQQHLTPKE